MPSKKDIYRQSALDRLSSPEHLEDLMQVIGLKGWIALSGLCVILVGAVAWGGWQYPQQRLRTGTFNKKWWH